MYALYTIDTAILCVAAILALRLQIIVNPPYNANAASIYDDNMEHIRNCPKRKDQAL